MTDQKDKFNLICLARESDLSMVLSNECHANHVLSTNLQRPQISIHSVGFFGIFTSKS